MIADGSGQPLLDWLAQAGPGGVLALVVFLFLRGTIVPGRSLDRALAERDRAMELVFQLAETSKRALEVAKQEPPS